MSAPLSFVTRFITRGPLRAETVCTAWEIFSALLFASAVVPAALDSPWPALVFTATLVVSALGVRALVHQGERAIAPTSWFRVVAWILAILPLPSLRGDFRTWVATATFGLMAAAMRRAIYRRELGSPPLRATDEGPAFASWLRARLAESAALAGILGGHLLLLFSVAFLRAPSSAIFRGWWELVPMLAVLATLGYTLAVRHLTAPVVAVLERGPSADRADLLSAARAVRGLPIRLSWLNFALWIACTSGGVFYFRPGPDDWRVIDAMLQIAYAALFAWGVAFYQRGWDRDTVAPVERSLLRLAEVEADALGDRPGYETFAIRDRMLRDFGWPLVFAAVLMLLSSIGLYRSLGAELGRGEDQAAVLAQVVAFFMLALAVGGIIARVARELSRPLVQVSDAAETVAGGKLDARMPRVEGPGEVAKLATSVERMRDELARTIAELEAERASLETKVEARTAELQKALSDLRDAQAALVLTERLASIGELVAGVAHEIGNPLNALAGSAEPLGEAVDGVKKMLEAYRQAEGSLTPEARAKVDALRRELDIDAELDDLSGIAALIRRASERSVRIVQNLKNFARTTGEALPTDLREGLEETLTLLAPRLRTADIEIDRRYQPMPEVTCRAGEINQVFMNLVVNAVQALEAGSPGKRTIVIETRSVGDQAEVAFTDSGPGVPLELERRIFDPFFTTKPPGQGTGLGLSISNDIVRKHGGTLHLERPAAGGARLVLRLPASRA